jgi:hypothetical protein
MIMVRGPLYKRAANPDHARPCDLDLSDQCFDERLVFLAARADNLVDVAGDLP